MKRTAIPAKGGNRITTRRSRRPYLLETIGPRAGELTHSAATSQLVIAVLRKIERKLMSISNPNVPKSILAFRSYTAQMFLHDLLAGITVGLVALPLAMAFGIASGVTPQAGLYTAVVAGFLISALGGSRTQIGGPTGAFVVIVAGIVARFGMSGLAMVTLMAGILSACHGPHRPWRRSALHSAHGRHRIHQRHRHTHRLHADQRLLGPAHRRCAQ